MSQLRVEGSSTDPKMEIYEDSDKKPVTFQLSYDETAEVTEKLKHKLSLVAENEQEEDHPW